MNTPTPAEREAIEAEDAAFFARNPDRRWRLRLPMPGETAEAVAVHRSGPRIGLTPAPAWTASEEQIKAIVLTTLSPSEWEQFKAALIRRRQQ